MTYEETIDFLFNKTLVFQHVGTPAYKPGLETTAAINAVFGNPDRSFKSIHIAGTNGKGSTAHLIAAILQNSGYKVGLYTSPHLLDFRERIRVDGKMIEREYVADFVGRFLSSGYKGRQASFFELTTIMAFDYFRHCGVDYAVLETGLGGRLDSTNIVSPILSVITNISLDHTQFLGDTLAKIAAEKAGIIKSGTPVVVGETTAETKPVFAAKSAAENAPIRFAEEHNEIISSDLTDGKLRLTTKNFGIIDGELIGDCQIKNANTVLNAITCLKSLGVEITDNAVVESFAHVCEQTGLMGRWMKIAEKPLTADSDRLRERQGHRPHTRYDARRCHILFYTTVDTAGIAERTAKPESRRKRASRRGIPNSGRSLPCGFARQRARRYALRRRQHLHSRRPPRHDKSLGLSV